MAMKPIGQRRGTMRARATIAGLLIAVAVTGAACGGDDPAPAASGTPPATGSDSTFPADALTIEQALGGGGDLPLLVKGFVVAADGETPRFCSALLESYPPQCGGPSLEIERLDLTSIDGLQSTDDPDLAQVTWSETEITLLGNVADDTITVADDASQAAS
jgi:hypothetical protein